ncbi:tRNA-dihydrouridine synthase [bacterium]|nr:tRNA-dihydrouridine synthase [bacterium]
MKKDFWKKLNKPIIGLAPMEGYSDSPFRRICKRINPDIITVTEFTSADGIYHNAKQLMKKLSFEKEEHPIIAQIFGKNMDTFIAAAKVCEDMGFDGIDINMGCPAKKVVKSEHGVALRRNLPLAFKLIETLANATSLPVSVKTRLGWDDASDLTEFGKGAENAGADMICIHGRTYIEPYNVPAQWEPVYEMKRNISIPVLGNGGILNVQDGLEKIGNLDGFLIGQATFGNPWAFLEKSREISFEEKLPIIKLHSQMLIEQKGEYVGTREIRKHLVSYCRGFPGAKQFRPQLVRVESYKQICDVLDRIAEAVEPMFH